MKSYGMDDWELEVRFPTAAEIYLTWRGSGTIMESVKTPV
jgi:hypothetical protein